MPEFVCVVCVRYIILSTMQVRPSTRSTPKPPTLHEENTYSLKMKKKVQGAKALKQRLYVSRCEEVPCHHYPSL